MASSQSFIPIENHSERQKYSKRVTLIGSVVDALLAVGKITIGILYHSHALIIDGIHSFTDLFTDFFVIIISHYSHAGPDEQHPYGHEKFETIGTAALGSILLGTAGALIYETIGKVLNPGPSFSPGWQTFVIAFISIVSKEAIFQYTKMASKKIGSDLLLANAWHSRTDAISSIVVFIGLIFAYFNYVWVDSIAAVIVALLIAKVGWGFVQDSLQELAEASLDPQIVRDMKKLILSVEGVKDAHALRTRKMGPKILLDVNIEVDSKITVSEGHEIAAWVAKVLKENHKEIADVTVHTDIEDDMMGDFFHNLSEVLPLRAEVIEELTNRWGDYPLFNAEYPFQLHYLQKKIEIEIILPLGALKDEPFKDLQLLRKDLHQKCDDLEWFGGICFLLRPAHESK
jgi:cation diffusion facilitator family transporter